MLGELIYGEGEREILTPYLEMTVRYRSTIFFF